MNIKADGKLDVTGQTGDAAKLTAGVKIKDWNDYEVVAVPGSRAVKVYRCPGCDHEIRCGTPHVVVWLAEDGPVAAADDRRHWHTPCWANRANRGPTRKWS